MTIETRLLILGALVACGGRSPEPTPPQPAPPDAAASVDAAPVADAPLAPVLSDADCRALAAAPAAGLAVVRSARPDCSSVGHLRVVLDVKKLVRGEAVQPAITTIVATRPLYGEPRLAEGDTVLVAIEPGVAAATTAACVPLPARQGTATRLVRLDAPAVTERALAEVAAGCAR